jgi:hypothetical protein
MGEDNGDVGPGPEPQHTQQQQLHHLPPVICIYIDEGKRRRGKITVI